jgi:hypothetical protein
MLAEVYDCRTILENTGFVVVCTSRYQLPFAALWFIDYGL